MGAAHSQAWRTAPHVFDLPLRPVLTALCGRDAAATAAAAQRYGFGGRPRPTGAPCWTATTCSSSTCARPVTRTPRSPSPRWTPASTCCARSRWPTRWPRRRRWPRPPQRAQARGVRSMVGFNYRRVPALALARQLVTSGRIGDDPPRPGQLPAGLAGRPGLPADLAAAEGARRLRGPGRPGRAYRGPGPVPDRAADHRGLRHDRNLRSRTPAARGGSGPPGPSPAVRWTTRSRSAPGSMPGRWPRSRRPGSRPAGRTRCASS